MRAAFSIDISHCRLCGIHMRLELLFREAWQGAVRMRFRVLFILIDHKDHDKACGRVQTVIVGLELLVMPLH